MATTSFLASTGGNLMKAARTIREEARRERLLNAKTRTIGIDVDALDAAVMEHKQQAAAKAAEDKAYAEYVASITAYAEDGERAAMQEDIDTNIELLANWELQADKTKRMEWDLNDPDALKKEKPARVGDDDPRCGPSSMQMFDGEDLHKSDREAALLADMVAGIEAQLREHRNAKAEADAERRAYAEYESVLLHDVQVAELEEQREQLVERLRLMNENKMLARARRVRERDAAEAARKAELEQVASARNSALLTESRVLAVNFSDSRRVRRDHYKGMSREQLAAIQAEQQAQREALAARRAAEKADDAAWAERVRQQVEAAKAMEAQAEAERVADQRQYYLDIKAQQRAAKLARKAQQEAFTNEIQPRYFDKFNQTSHN